MALNVDGYRLPGDWYLQFADQAGKLLRSTMPITP